MQLDETGKPMPDQLPADVTSGTVYHTAEDEVLCEIAWIDKPRAEELVQLLEAAADALMADAGAAD